MMRVILSIIMFFPLLLTGCWDRLEIEEVGFVMALGMDPVKNDEEWIKKLEQETGLNVKGQDKQAHLFRSTFQVAIPRKMIATDGGGQGQAFFNISTIGLSNFKMERNIASRSGRRLNFEHMKVIIIHQDLVKKGLLRPLIDFYVREHEMRRQTYIFISEEETLKVLDNNLPLQDLLAQSMQQISENYSAALPMIKPSEIGNISEKIIGNRSFLVSRVLNQKGENLKISGAAVINGKSGKMVGWLTDEDAKGYNWIEKEDDNSVIQAVTEGRIIVLETFETNANVKYKRENGKDIFEIDIDASGSLGESWVVDLEISDTKTIKKFEQVFAKRIEQQVRAAIEKAQKEFHSDFFEFYDQIRKKDYQYWKEIKSDWDAENGGFSHADFHVKANVKIRHYMLNERMQD